MQIIYDTKIPKKTIFLICIFAALLALTFFACKKSPTDGVKLSINTNIIKYSAFVQVRDAASTTKIPANATIRISGQDASYVYEISGKRKFTLTNGTIDVGLNPIKAPATGKPVKFNIEVSAPGYLPVSREVVMNADQFQQNVKIQMLDLSSPPSSIRIASMQLGNVGATGLPSAAVLKIGVGKVVTAAPAVRQTQAIGTQSVGANGVYYDDALTSVVVGQGATFHYYAQADGTPAGTDYIPELNAPADGYATQKLLLYRSYGYYDYENYAYDAKIYTQKAYTGPVTAVVTYVTGAQDKPFGFMPNIPSEYQRKIYYVNGYDQTVAQGSAVPANASEDEMLFASAVKAPITSITFIGQLADGTSITLKPDNTAPWYISMVCNGDAANPNTGKLLKNEKTKYLEIGVKSNSSYYNTDFYSKNNVDTTIATEAQLADNGEYRVAVRATDAGFYYHAKNIAVINYSYNTYCDTAFIPDPENLYAVVGVGAYDSGTGKNIQYVQNICPDAHGYDNHQTVGFNGKIVSNSPIIANCSFQFYYWNKLLNYSGGTAMNPYMSGAAGLSGGTFSIPYLWDMIDKTQLSKEVSFDIGLNCQSNSNIIVKPWVAGVITGDDGSQGVYFVKNGHWATRKMVPGSNVTYTLGAQAGSTNIGFSQKMEPGIFYYNKVLAGGDACNNF